MTSPSPLPGVNMMMSALWWARRGIPVLPLHYPDGGACSCGDTGCSSVGKHPMSRLVPKSLTQASTDPDQVRDWWTQQPYANIGIRTGEVVDLLDIDSTDGLTAFGALVQRVGMPAHLGVARSGRDGAGMHYYVGPGGMRALAGGKTAPAGIDVKGRGGYAVVPPSMHASGRRYEWVEGRNYFDDGALIGDVDWPEFYRELEVRPQRPPVAPRPVTELPADAADAYGRAVLRRAIGLVQASTSGNRWQTLATEAIPLVARGIDGGCIDRDTGVRELSDAAAAVGLDQREVTRIGAVVDHMVAQGITHPIRPSAAPAGVTDAAAPQAQHETEDEARADPWDPPWPMRHPTPPFPVDEVMGWMAGPIKELSAQLQTPVDLVAMMTLAAVSATVRGRIRARFVGDWEEPLNLYVCAVLGPGETKSPALSKIVAPLRKMEEEARAEAKKLIVEAAFTKEILDGRAKKLREEAMKYTGDNHYEATRMQAQAREAAEEAEQASVPVEPRWLAGDMTPEALVSMLAQQGGSLAHLSAEGELLDTILGGRYSSGAPHISALLTAHDGREPLLVHRKRDDDIEVPNPCLTLGLAVQPQVLEQMGSTDVAMRRGLAARFLFSLPASLVGRRNMVPRGADVTGEQFAALLHSVNRRAAHGRGSGDYGPRSGHYSVRGGGGVSGIRVPDGPENPRNQSSQVRGVQSDHGDDASSQVRGFGDYGPVPLKYGFLDSSSSLLIHYREALEPRRAATTGDLGEIGPWANKIDGQLVRLAVLLQMLRDADPNSPTGESCAQNPQNLAGMVGVEAASAALVLMDYLIAHAIEAHAVMASAGKDTNLPPAEQLLGWIRGQHVDEFTVHDAERSLRKRVTFREPGSVDVACATLARLGWIRYVPPEPGKPGRPSVRYLVHPEALQ
jgi:hypothetical protein